MEVGTSRRLLYLGGAITTLVLYVCIWHRSRQARSCLPSETVSGSANRKAAGLRRVDSCGDDNANPEGNLITAHNPKSPDGWTAHKKESSVIRDPVMEAAPLRLVHTQRSRSDGPENLDCRRADAWLRNKHYTSENLRIERLSGESLPMDQCYINLAVVEQSLDAGLKKGYAAPESSQFSLWNRLKVETLAKEHRVELPTLFDSRQTPAGHWRAPRRILIRGRAGVGKSTLCKKATYSFCNTGMWADLFERVLWVPLRKLKLLSPHEYNYKDFFSCTYFAASPDHLRLAEGLQQAVDFQAINGRGTLFLLDGLDEVSEFLDPAHRASAFLTDLLNRPNVVITTRPHTTFPLGVNKPDAEFETIGFYPSQVEDYLEHVVQDSRKATKIRTFLQRRQLMQSLFRIPIQLDALCFLWDEEFGRTPESMTAVYKAVVERLWKKDIPRLGKKSEHFVDSASAYEVRREVSVENQLLECFAFSGLCSNTVDFQPAHRNAVYEQFASGNSDLSLDERLARLSFLRTSDASAYPSNRSYHFLHLTFQEYFAAQYFVRHWNDGSELAYVRFLDTGEIKTVRTDTHKFLHEHRYMDNYNVLWRYVAGLLDEAETASFFEALEHEPLRRYEVTQRRLFIHCLREVDISTRLQIRCDLETKVAWWLLSECEATGFARLAREAECSESALCAALVCSTGHSRVLLLRALSAAHQHLTSATLETHVTLLKEDSDDVVRSIVASVLARQAQLPPETVDALVTLLAHSNSFVRSSAAQALRSRPGLPNHAMAALVALLKDESRSARSSAAEALAVQPLLPREAVTGLCALLGDDDTLVRISAAHALRARGLIVESQADEAVRAPLSIGKMSV